MSSPAPEGRKTMTQAAIEANRRNAQKSTGPKTTEGKAKSRMNAVKHYGYALKIDPLLPTENPDQYEQFSQSLFDMYRPQNVLQVQLVEMLVYSMWTFNRLPAQESLALTYCPDPGHQNEESDKISRVMERKFRMMMRLVKELRETQAIVQAHLETQTWPTEVEMTLPESHPVDLPGEGTILPVGLAEIPDGGIPNKYQFRNPSVTSGLYNRFLDQELGKIHHPNPTLRDLVKHRLSGIPLGALPDITGRMQ